MQPIDITVHAGEVPLEGALSIPERAQAVVVFAHGSGSSRFSPRNRMVAAFLNQGGLGTLLFDLLTAEESEIDERTGELRFDIEFLGRRPDQCVDWLAARSEFAAPSGRALRRQHRRGGRARCRGGSPGPSRCGGFAWRPTRSGHGSLPRVRAPTLLIVGSLDGSVIGMNRQAAARLQCEHRVEIVPGATHLFEEPGKLEEVARLARDWFQQHLGGAPPRPAGGDSGRTARRAAPDVRLPSHGPLLSSP